jgi:hypothetical protein
MIGKGIMANAVTIMATKIVVKMVTIKAMTGMITDIIMGIDQSPDMITTTMSISNVINMMVIGIRGIHGNTLNEDTPIIQDMVITKNIITNYFSCLMMA